MSILFIDRIHQNPLCDHIFQYVNVLQYECFTDIIVKELTQRLIITKESLKFKNRNDWEEFT